MYITIVGAGVQGTRVARAYAKLPSAHLRAVVSRSRPQENTFAEVPFFSSARDWRKRFGKPTGEDIFDLNVHQKTLTRILEDFISIGARNFVLPKPLALTKAELTALEKLVSHHKLSVTVASQWHYSALIEPITRFVRAHRSEISSAEIVFSRSFPAERRRKYTAATAFLPHMLQILLDTKLIGPQSLPLPEHLSDTRIAVSYAAERVRVVTDLRPRQEEESLRIFLKGRKQPALAANFAYPSFCLMVNRRRREIREDVLEKMIAAPEALTFEAYLPVARQLVRIAEQAPKTVAVIGGGIFGITSALAIARKGYPVVIFEKEQDLIQGASLVNQCRVHMGYHYPRDIKTAGDSLDAKAHFEKRFAPAIRQIDNYYLVAKEGSLTSARRYAAFCQKIGLPYAVSWPRGVVIIKEKIEKSFKVPETIFDAHKVRDLLRGELLQADMVARLTSARVVGLKRERAGFTLSYQHNGHVRKARFAAVVSAAYAGANVVNKLVGLPLAHYQYELCEMPVVSLPWRGVGWSVIDGPFFGAMPFGFSDDYLLYDVELSVLERSIGGLPRFKHDAKFYDDKKRRAARFQAYKDKWKPVVPEVTKAEYLYSLYTTRVVLPRQEETDARPTIIKELLPGLWQLFTGKVTASVPLAAEIAQKVDAFLAPSKRARPSRRPFSGTARRATLPSRRA
jgi:hypothetical protein